MGKFNLDQEFARTEVLEEIVPKGVSLAIFAKTVTPLLQIDDTGGQRKRYVYESGLSGPVPFFSANGFRGALRRFAFAQQVNAAKKIDPDYKVDPEIFYLYTSGGGFGKTSAKLDEYITPFSEETVRKNAPILSLFGAGLSHLEGKIAISDLAPEPEFVEIEKDDKTILVSKLIGSNTFYRSDSAIASKALFRPIMDMEDIERWREEYFEKVAQAKEKKKKGESEREESSHIQQPATLEFIIPGVKLQSGAAPKYGYELSDVELGCLVAALVELSKAQIGSAKRIGFGVLDWYVEMDGEKLFESTSDPDYVFKKIVDLTEKGKKAIEAWEEWLKENATKMTLEEIAE